MAVLSAALATDGAAQNATGLGAVEHALESGRTAEARALLEAWTRTVAARDDQPDAARAMLLQARLTTEFDSASELLIGVVMRHPSSDAAPEALLRLGQAWTAAGDAARAVGYLERLVQDYPGVRQRTTGLVWLARAQRLAGTRTRACTSARRAVAAAATDDDALLSLALDEQHAACSSDAAHDERAR